MYKLLASQTISSYVIRSFTVVAILTVVNCVRLSYLSLMERTTSPSLLVRQRIRTDPIRVRRVVIVRIAIVVHNGEIRPRNDARLDVTLLDVRFDPIIPLTPLFYQTDLSVDSFYIPAINIQVNLEGFHNTLQLFDDLLTVYDG